MICIVALKDDSERFLAWTPKVTKQCNKICIQKGKEKKGTGRCAWLYDSMIGGGCLAYSSSMGVCCCLQLLHSLSWHLVCCSAIYVRGPNSHSRSVVMWIKNKISNTSTMLVCWIIIALYLNVPDYFLFAHWIFCCMSQFIYFSAVSLPLFFQF
jgi:hypothetical protein